jgi:uncharacterized membrane protein YhaH (DUF805 family)
MMKMHGLGDVPYWIVSYTYFLLISILYMLCFAIFGSLIGNNSKTLLMYFYVLSQFLMLLLFLQG